MSYSKGGKKPDKQCAKASKAQAKYAKRHARCGKSKPKSKPHGTITPEQAGGISESIRSKLLERSLSVAAANGDATPYDIEAVATTYGQKIEALPNGAHPANEPASTPMYVVAMRGEFAGLASCVTGPPGTPAQCPRGPSTWIEIEFTAATMSTRAVGKGNGAPPNLATLGTPVELKAPAPMPQA